MKNRLIKVPVSFELILDLMKNDYEVSGTLKCIQGIPPDAEYIDSYHSPLKHVVYFVFYHPSFAPIEFLSDEAIPELEVRHSWDHPFDFDLVEDMTEAV